MDLVKIPIPINYSDEIHGFVIGFNCWLFTAEHYEPSYWLLLKREGFSGGLVSDSSELDSITNQMDRNDLESLYRIHHRQDPDHYFDFTLREDIDELILSSRIKVFKLDQKMLHRLGNSNDVLYSSRTSHQRVTDPVIATRHNLAEEFGKDIATRWLGKDKADKLHWDRGIITREAYEAYNVGETVVKVAADVIVSIYQIGKAVITIAGKTIKIVGEFNYNIIVGNMDEIKKDLDAAGIYIENSIKSAGDLIEKAKQGVEIFNKISNDPESSELVFDYFSSLYESITYEKSRTIGVIITTTVGIEILLALATAGAGNVARKVGQAGVKVAQGASATKRIGPFTLKAVDLLADLSKHLHKANIKTKELPKPKNPDIPKHSKAKPLDGSSKDSTMQSKNIVQNKLPKYTNLKQMDSQFIGEETGAVWGTKVKYLNDMERQQYLLQIKNGKLFDAEENLFDTTKANSAFGGSGNAIFVMDENGSIFASNVHSPGKFHHSSFLAGKPVASAGEIVVKNGLLKGVTRRSGHYQPTGEQLDQFLQQLKQKNIALDNVDIGAGF